MVIFDPAPYAAQALAIRLFDAHNANSAPDRKRLSRPLGTMRRNVQSAVDKLTWSEDGFSAAVEPIATYVLGFSGPMVYGVLPLKLNGPMYARPEAAAAIRRGLGSWILVCVVGGHTSALPTEHVGRH